MLPCYGEEEEGGPGEKEHAPPIFCRHQGHGKGPCHLVPVCHSHMPVQCAPATRLPCAVHGAWWRATTAVRLWHSGPLAAAELQWPPLAMALKNNKPPVPTGTVPLDGGPNPPSTPATPANPSPPPPPRGLHSSATSVAPALSKRCHAARSHDG